MSHPEKLEAALKDARAENDAFAASRTISRNDVKARPKPANQQRSAKKRGQSKTQGPFAA